MVSVRNFLASGYCPWPLLAGGLALIAVGLLGDAGAALAMVERRLLEIPVYAQSNPEALRQQAEAMATALVEQQFAQQPGLDRLEIVVSGNRNGEITPLLTVAVARSQWLADPQINRWARHYDVAYGLMLRHSSDSSGVVAQGPAAAASGRVAAAGTGSARRRSNWTEASNAAGSPYTSSQIQSAQDGGWLPGRVAQGYLNDLD